MIAVDGSVLYDLGQVLQPLKEVTVGSTSNAKATYGDMLLDAASASGKLRSFISVDTYSSAIQVMAEPAKQLIGALDRIEMNAVGGKYEEKIEFADAYKLSTALQAFESVFRAEIRYANMFLPSPKGAYDIRALISNGERLFPQPQFGEHFPDAVSDVQAGARCLAFELFTASGFHFHRANEVVILEYIAKLAKKKYDGQRNMGQYVGALREAGAPKPILSCLRDLKDLHRNPLMHPEQSIDTEDEAIALLNAIHTAVTAMIREIVAAGSG